MELQTIIFCLLVSVLQSASALNSEKDEKRVSGFRPVHNLRDTKFLVRVQPWTAAGQVEVTCDGAMVSSNLFVSAYRHCIELAETHIDLFKFDVSRRLRVTSYKWHKHFGFEYRRGVSKNNIGVMFVEHIPQIFQKQLKPISLCLYYVPKEFIAVSTSADSFGDAVEVQSKYRTEKMSHCGYPYRMEESYICAASVTGGEIDIMMGDVGTPLVAQYEDRHCLFGIQADSFIESPGTMFTKMENLKPYVDQEIAYYKVE